MKLAVYGLGRLGHVLLNVLAQAGFDVVGVDPNLREIELLKSTEPGLRYDKTIAATSGPVPADVSFIVVPTPSLDKGDHSGGFDSYQVECALRHISRVNEAILAEEKPIAVIVSTVSPGTCERLQINFPELRIVYNPTFIALGDVVEGLTRPDLLLVGADDSTIPLEALTVLGIWKQVFEQFGPGATKGAHAHVAGYTEIELIKLSVNAALGTKISLANSLGALFKAYGVDPAAVKVVGRDPRIGMAYFTPGSPIAGPCLPRDNVALEFAGIKVGVELPLAHATGRVNHGFLHQLFLDVYYGALPRDDDNNPTGTVGILGMSYKYGSDIRTGSAGDDLERSLRSVTIGNGIGVRTYDTWAPHNTELIEDIAECDVIVVTQREYLDSFPRLTKMQTQLPKGKVIKIWE